MINEWLERVPKPDQYVFKLIHVTEIKKPDDNIINFLQTEILQSYRDIDFYKFHLQNSTEDDIRNYVKTQIIPGDENQIVRNVRQGDWGEILTSLIVAFYQGLEVPISKLKWKFNKDRSVFGTDMIAHERDIIKNIYYYEIKTRLSPDTKEGTAPNRNYITIHAHNSLLNDINAPSETIADFLERYFFDKQDYEKARMYKDIIKNPNNYNKNFELFFIIEKSKFIEDILVELNRLPPALTPLNTTIVFIDDLKDLIDKSWNDIENSLVKILSENN